MFIIKEAEPEQMPKLNTNPADAVSSAIRMAWAEYRDAGWEDERIFHYLAGVCTTANLEQSMKNAAHSWGAR